MKVSTLHFLAFRKYLSMEVGVKCIFGRVARVSGVVVANKLVARSTDDRLSVHSSISGCWRVWRLAVTIISFCYVNTALTNFLIILAHRREVELSIFLGYRFLLSPWVWVLSHELINVFKSFPHYLSGPKLSAISSKSVVEVNFILLNGIIFKFSLKKKNLTYQIQFSVTNLSVTRIFLCDLLDPFFFPPQFFVFFIILVFQRCINIGHYRMYIPLIIHMEKVWNVFSSPFV